MKSGKKSTLMKEKNNSIKQEKKCEGCGNKKCKKDRVRDIYICDSCDESIEYKLICKTYAKNQYFLTPDDLDNLDYYTKSRGSYPMFAESFHRTLTHDFDFKKMCKLGTELQETIH